jgi:hypothetical protein
VLLVKRDPAFSGCLEEELVLESEVAQFCYPEESSITLTRVPQGLTLDFSAVPEGIHKSCNIHLSVELGHTSERARTILDDMQFITFEKPISRGIRKVYTVTCYMLEDGLIMHSLLRQLITYIGPITGKLKLERTARFFRFPACAEYLPMQTHQQSAIWIDTARSTLQTLAT